MSDQDKKDKKQEVADFFLTNVDQFGVAASIVSDGVVLGFNRAHMQDIINQNPDKEILVIFVQNRKFQN